MTDKRPKAVIDHILKHGLITTDELKPLYGYNHPPRAARMSAKKEFDWKHFAWMGRTAEKLPPIALLTHRR